MANTTGKKFGGRKKGSPNRLTKEVRLLLKDLVFSELESLQQQLDNLENKDRIEILLKLLPYVLPKVNSVNANQGEPIDWNF
ncbi:MAG: hypothetical protein ABJJ25_00890 [Eudoraea sp.]|uniref:hypothetical protein n=1 Tax=Eudoraea sp. TaxID=1979955 RepID=UPI0032666355